MTKARTAVERLYDGKCTVTEQRKVIKANMSTGFVETAVLEDQPCRLSYRTIANTNPFESAASAVTQVTVLFISPDIEIKPGSKITVTQNGVTTDYEKSGEPARYATHQEIVLDLFRGWA